jgi:MFS family permease
MLGVPLHWRAIPATTGHQRMRRIPGRLIFTSMAHFARLPTSAPASADHMNHIPPATLERPTAGPRSLPRPVAFWLVAFAIAAFTVASSAPSPLYPVYQAEFKFSDFTLTLIFAIYVFALMMSLLTVGRLSDYVGRRVVFAGALLVEAGAMAMFVAADGVGWLLWARIVQGLASGAAIGMLGAYLIDLQPSDGSRLGSLVNSVAPTFGFGFGAIVTGLLVEYAPHPTRLIFVILMGVFLALALATLVLPETVPHVPGAVAALRPEIAVPTRAKRAFAGAVPTMVSTWALGGLFLSLGGSLLATVFGQTNHAVIGLVIGLFPVSAAALALLFRDLSSSAMARIGSAGLVIGTGLILLSLVWSSITLFVIASIVAGAGLGSGFLGSIRAVSQLAEPHERAALLSAVYVVTYLAFSLPALVAGVLTTHIGLRNTTFAYGGFVAVVAVASAVLERMNHRRRPDPTRP